MAKNLPAKARAELDRYKKSANRARKQAKSAPMEAAVSGAPVSIGCAGAFGLIRKNVPLVDSTTGELVVALSLAAFGYMTGNPMGIQAATGIACVAAHNAAESSNIGG